MTALALTCGAVAAGLAATLVVLRHRLKLVARAEHELRAPLTALSLGLEAARRGDVHRLADALEAQLERAEGGLADLAAARAGRRAAGSLETVSLDRFVQQVAAAWRPIAERAGRRLHVEWSAGSVTVRADRRRLAQVLGNLISNAVEHGEGSVRVRGERNAGAVRLEVTDGGSGVSHQSPRRRDGRGHGLAIAMRATEDAGGTLTVGRRSDGGGTVVELPIDRR